MRVVVVGAGIAGLVAARELAAHDATVRIVDKGRSVGGRLATRRIGDARLDHGAQFFTVRTPAFRARVDDWLDRGVVRVWNHGFDADDGHPRYVGSAGMNSIAKDLAVGLDVETATMAFTVRPGSGGHRWEVAIDDGTARPADAVVLTSPIPQSLALLVDAGVDFDGSPMRTEYDRTIGLLATLDGPAALPASGGVQDGDAVFSFIGDNASKGISATPAVTFHANPAWSEAHWDDDDLLDQLSAAARPWLGTASIVEAQVKKWRLAAPRTIWPDPCWTTGDGSIVLAGDAFAGPKVEGAHNSGLAAAHALLA
jgi:predicted NAD/FAD-dependent oxidoreductase